MEENQLDTYNLPNDINSLCTIEENSEYISMSTTHEPDALRGEFIKIVFIIIPRSNK